MAWSTPATSIAGSVLTAAWLNTYLRDNMNELRAGGMAIAGQAANRIPYASSATQLATSADLTFDGSVLSAAGADSRSVRITRSGSVDAGLQITNGVRTFGITNDSSGVLRIQDDSDGTPRVEMNGTDIGLVGGTTTVTGNVQVTGRYASGNTQPGFLAFKSANSTGLSIAEPLIFDSEVYDTTGSYNAATGVFTAPVTGLYLFCATVYTSTPSTARLTSHVRLTSNSNSHYFGRTHVETGEEVAVSGAVIIEMTATVTAQINWGTSGGTQTIVGNAGIRQTFFSGRLLA